MSRQQVKTKVKTELKYPSNYNVIVFNGNQMKYDRHPFVLKCTAKLFYFQNSEIGNLSGERN